MHASGLHACNRNILDALNVDALNVALSAGMIMSLLM